MLTLLQTDPYESANAVSGAAAAGLGNRNNVYELMIYILWILYV
jgi:hypothetical protein